jgi:hypothetical protein
MESAIGLPSGAYRQHNNGLSDRVFSKTNAPVTHAKPPLFRNTPQPLDITLTRVREAIDSLATALPGLGV